MSFWRSLTDARRLKRSAGRIASGKLTLRNGPPRPSPITEKLNEYAGCQLGVRVDVSTPPPRWSYRAVPYQ